jgi:general secretion pathway protein M
MKLWLAGLQERERRTLMLGAVALALILGYLYLFEPLMSAREQAGSRVQAQRALLAHLQRVAAEASLLKGSGPATRAVAPQSILAAVDQSSRQAGIKPSIKRLTPEGSKKVRLWLEKASFDQLMGWLAGVNAQSGLVVENINLTPEDEPGLVRVNLTLVMP